MTMYTKHMTPNWERNGIASRPEALAYILSCLKDDEKKILKNGLVDGNGYSQAVFFLGDTRIELSAKRKSAKV